MLRVATPLLLFFALGSQASAQAHICVTGMDDAYCYIGNLYPTVLKFVPQARYQKETVLEQDDLGRPLARVLLVYSFNGRSPKADEATIKQAEPELQEIRTKFVNDMRTVVCTPEIDYMSSERSFVAAGGVIAYQLFLFEGEHVTAEQITTVTIDHCEAP